MNVRLYRGAEPIAAEVGSRTISAPIPWSDPLAGVVGAIVIAAWSWSLVRATGSILLDMNPDRTLTERVRLAIEENGDRLTDLHVWRLGPGHLGAIVSVRTAERRNCEFFRAKLAGFRALSHVTVEVRSI